MELNAEQFLDKWVIEVKDNLSAHKFKSQPMFSHSDMVEFAQAYFLAKISGFSNNIEPKIDRMLELLMSRADFVKDGGDR